MSRSGSNKHCPACGADKPTSEFFRNASRADGLSGHCKPCHRARVKPYSEIEPERRRRYAAAARANQDPDRLRIWNQRYEERNRERRAAYQRGYHRRNRDRMLEYQRRYDAEHPELVRAHRKLMTAKRRGATTVPFKPAQLTARLSMFPGCWVCGGPKEQVDHVKPIAKGGPHMLANLRPICAPCNLRKRDAWPLAA